MDLGIILERSVGIAQICPMLKPDVKRTGHKRGRYVISKLGYISYMLRLWQTWSGGRLVWRASLESPHTGERQGFADLEELFELLRGQVGEDQARDAGRQGGTVGEDDGV